MIKKLFCIACLLSLLSNNIIIRRPQIIDMYMETHK